MRIYDLAEFRGGKYEMLSISTNFVILFVLWNYIHKPKEEKLG